MREVNLKITMALTPKANSRRCRRESYSDV